MPTSFSKLDQLEDLNLSFNFNINSDNTANILSNVKSLEKLNIADSYFTETAVNLLMDALPTCAIVAFTPKKVEKD